MVTDNPTEPDNGDDQELTAFVTSYQEALSDGRPLPSPDILSPSARIRWDRMRGVLHRLARAGKSSTDIFHRREPATILLRNDELLSPDERTNRPQPRLGRYLLERELGRGGMGIVYLARDPELDRLVAVKTLSASGAEERQRLFRFAAEGRLHARQQHPNIVQVYEVGEDQGQPFLVMEYVPGPSLSQHLDGRPIEPRHAAELLEVMARAIAYAHQAGIVHRDLKPANILMRTTEDTENTETNPKGDPSSLSSVTSVSSVVKITDFGLATTVTHSFDLTRTGDLVGTPTYMAPEMLSSDGERAGASVDIYGLGVILYEMLTGHPPFLGADAFFILSQVQSAEPIPPRQLHPRVPADLNTICLKCLEKNPQKRYATAGALADDVRRFLDDRPILARPAGPLERAIKFARRRPALTLTGLFSFASLLAVAVVLAVASVQLRDERDRARRGEENAREAQKQSEARLVERNVTLGLSAEKASNLPEAALWFAEAARQSRDPIDALDNRVRWRNWTAASPVPWRAFQVPEGTRVHWLGLHPSARWVITGGKGWQLWDLDREEVIPWPGPPRMVTAAAWSPDGTVLATGSQEGTVHCFDFPSGRLRKEETGKGPIECLTFAPKSGVLAWADGDHRLRARVSSGDAALLLDEKQPSPVVAITFSPGGGRLATLCLDHSACVFALGNEGRAAGPLLGPLKQHYTRAAFPSSEAPDFLSEDEVVSADGKEISIWDLTTGKKTKSLPGGAYQDCGAGISAAGGYIVVWRHLQEPELWRTGDERPFADRTVRSPPADTVLPSPDGRQFLLGFKNGVQLWNRDRSPASGVLWHHSTAHPLAWTADGRWFATAGKGSVVRLWRVAQDRPLSLPLPPQAGLPIVFGLCPGAADVLTATTKDNQSEFQRCALADGKAEGPPLRVAGIPAGVACSPEGQVHYAVTRDNDRGWLYAWKRGSTEFVFAPVPLPFAPHDVACRPDGGALVVAGGESEIELRQASDGKLICRHPSDRPQAQAIFVCDQIRFAPDGQSFVTFGRGDRVWQWDARDGTVLQRFTLPSGNRCVAASFSRDGRYLAGASTNGQGVFVWDVSDGSRVELPHPDFVFAARFDDTGKRLVTACRDGKTRVWDWRAKEMTLPALAQSEEITDAAFSPDGRWIASAEAGGRLRLWDARSGLPLAPGWLLQPPGEPFPYFANRVEFSADGRFLLVGVRKRHLLVFDMARITTAPPEALTPDDLILLAEIDAGTALRPGGHVEPLTTEQWLARWQTFRRRHPSFHAWPAPDGEKR